MILGITGGSGCGKTTLLKVIAEQGGLVLDCDAIYHELLQKDKALLDAIEARFPGVVEAGSLRRKKLGAIVFSDRQALEALNGITHRAVRQEVLRRLESRPELAAIDAIALIEGGLAGLCGRTVAVLAPQEQRIARLMARDGITRDYALARIGAQHEDAWFRQNCDAVLVNDSTPEAFREKCLAFLLSLGIMKERT